MLLTKYIYSTLYFFIEISDGKRHPPHVLSRYMPRCLWHGITLSHCKHKIKYQKRDNSMPRALVGT